MKRKNNNQDILFEALKKVHQNKTVATEKGTWQQDLMRKIRNLGPSQPTGFAGLSIDVLVWRFSLALFTIALIFTLYTVISGVFPDTEIASLFLQDIEGKFLYQPLASLALL